MTDEELEEIEQRANAATPGRHAWVIGHDPSNEFIVYDADPWKSANPTVIAETNSGGDAAFIAAARTDVPALIAEIRRLKKL